MEPEGSLPYSQEPSTGPWPEHMKLTAVKITVMFKCNNEKQRKILTWLAS
jgi:hypothetical protein